MAFQSSATNPPKMKKEIINTEKAPAPIGPYSQAVMAGNMLFVSGQIAINPQTNSLETANIEAETRQVMANLKAILEKSGLGFNDVVKATIFVKDLNNFQKINEVYGSYFTSDFPARETVEVSRLPKDVNVEISVVALKPGK
jgi:2-iminobutanoate/2-iminopropanoate deaminase